MTGLPKIVAKLGLETAREYLSDRTIDVVVEEQGVNRSTVFDWEKQLGVRTQRVCRQCQGTFLYEEMWLNARGCVQDSLCNSEECKSVGKKRGSYKKTRVDEEFASIPKVAEGKLPATLPLRGRLSYYVRLEECA